MRWLGFGFWYVFWHVFLSFLWIKRHVKESTRTITPWLFCAALKTVRIFLLFFPISCFWLSCGLMFGGFLGRKALSLNFFLTAWGVYFCRLMVNVVVWGNELFGFGVYGCSF